MRKKLLSNINLNSFLQVAIIGVLGFYLKVNYSDHMQLSKQSLIDSLQNSNCSNKYSVVMQAMSDKNSDVQRRLDISSDKQNKTDEQLELINRKLDILLYKNKINSNQYDLTKN